MLPNISLGVNHFAGRGGRFFSFSSTAQALLARSPAAQHLSGSSPYFIKCENIHKQNKKKKKSRLHKIFRLPVGRAAWCTRSKEPRAPRWCGGRVRQHLPGKRPQPEPCNRTGVTLSHLGGDGPQLLLATHAEKEHSPTDYTKCKKARRTEQRFVRY